MRPGVAQLIGWLVLACACSGQRDDAQPGIALRADSLIRLADSTYRQDHDSARRVWQLALEEASRLGDSVSIARALTGIGMAARLSGDYEESRRLGEQALAIKQRMAMEPRDLFQSYNALGLLAWTTERLSDASNLFERASEAARAANDSIALGKVTMNTGLVAKDQGAFDRSRVALQLGGDIARAAGDSVTLGRALNNLAMLDIALGDPIAAIASIEEARRLARSTGDSINEVNARGQLATAYNALGEPQRAFALLDSALTMAQRSGQRQEVAEDLMLIGDLFLEAGDHQHALDHYRRALVATDSLELPEERGNILRSEARAQAGLGNLTLAITRASDARGIHRDGGFTYPELDDLLVLAELAQRNGQPNDAESHLRAAQRIATELEAPIAAARVAIASATVAAEARQWDRVLRTIDEARGTLYLAGSSGEAEALALQARALAELGRHEAALATGRLAIAAVERVRGNYAAGELRTSYVSNNADVFSQQALLLLRLGRISEAFEVADAARGRALLEHLSQARADVRATSAAGPLLEQEALLRRIDALLVRLQERERDATPRERSPEYLEVTVALRDSVDALRSEFVALNARRARVVAGTQTIVGLARPAVEEIRASLQPGEVLLEYLVTPERLLIFVVTGDSVTVHVSEERAAELAPRVQLARELLRGPGSDEEARSVLRALFDIVLGPVVRSGTLRQAKRLIVVPHGVLTYLPFAALVDAESKQYVAERYVLLHLATSAALPALRKAESRTGSSSEPQVFAPVPKQLPATLREAESVAMAMPGASLHVGARATEGRLRKALQSGGIIHVATHASLNSRNPLFSYIEMARERRVTSDDNGRLEVHEFLGLRLDSPLVFLSGCETAIGGSWSTRFDTGEDYATIGQVLLYAGARNVVATLWRIDDVGAAEFARHFYEALPQAGYAEAIAEAQRKLLSDPRYRSPYYWAAYQVMGGGGRRARAANPGAVSDKP